MESTLKISAPEIWVRAGGRRYCVMLAPHTPYTTSSTYRLLQNQLLSPSSWPALLSSSTQAWLSKNTQVASNQKGSKSEALKISTKGEDTQTMIFSHFPVLCHVSLQEVICLRKCCLPVGFGILPPKNQFYCYQIIHTILWLNVVSCFFWSKSEIRRLFWPYQISDQYRLCTPYLTKTLRFVIIQVCLI